MRKNYRQQVQVDGQRHFLLLWRIISPAKFFAFGRFRASFWQALEACKAKWRIFGRILHICARF
jgi:hypothetical protein